MPLTLTAMRGFPGSGKSTLARQIANDTGECLQFNREISNVAKPKVVKKLKDKHKVSIWFDRIGDLWIYHCDTGEWHVYEFCCEGFELYRGADPNDDGDMGGWGPFTRIEC